MHAGNNSLIELLILLFKINAPIQVIISIGQWLVLARFIAHPDKTATNIMLCIFVSYISAYFLALIIWLAWPLDPELIMYNNRISIPAIIGEAIAIPFWIHRMGYVSPRPEE